MKPEQIKTYYKRNLPHIQPIGATFFVTFRLKGAIPRVKIWQLKTSFDDKIANIRNSKEEDKDVLIYAERKRFFAQYDALLDKCNSGPIYLANPEIAQIVSKELHRFDGHLYDLIAYSIMPNHVHVLFNTACQIPDGLDISLWEMIEFEPLNSIMKRIKGPTAVYANRKLNRSGQFWQRESYDHYIRNAKEYNNVVAYILDNPVKANLVNNWKNHSFTYVVESAK